LANLSDLSDPDNALDAVICRGRLAVDRIK